MIDYTKLEILLLPIAPILVKEGEPIGPDFWEWAKRVNPKTNRLREFFESGKKEGDRSVTYPTTFRCEVCLQDVTEPWSRTKIMEHVNRITSKKPIWRALECLGCVQKGLDIQRVRWRQDLEERTAKRLQGASESMDWLKSEEQLSKDEYWNPKEYVDRIRLLPDEMMQAEFGGMPYKQFLKTRYWRLVARLVKKSAGDRCAICNKKEQLTAHHRSYEFRGLDHTWHGIKNLTCICDACHRKHHDIKDEV